MCNACDPGAEFTVLGIFALFYGGNGLDERILKNIVSQVAIANHIQNVTEKGLFVPGKKNLKRTVIAFGIRCDQLLVGHQQKIVHYLIYIWLLAFSFWLTANCEQLLI